MIVLGIDPGIRNTGLALVDTSKRVRRAFSVFNKRGDWYDMASIVGPTIELMKFDRAVLESVGYYGPRKGMYQLNRLVGAIWYSLFGLLDPTDIQLMMPNQKVKLTKTQESYAASEHSKDAISLAIAGINYWKTKETQTPNATRSNKSRRKTTANVNIS